MTFFTFTNNGFHKLLQGTTSFKFKIKSICNSLKSKELKTRKEIAFCYNTVFDRMDIESQMK